MRGVASRAAVVMVAVCLTVAGGCAGEEPVSPQRPAALVTSGPATGDLLVHGVVEADGEPAAGARVWITLMPEPDDTPVGGQVDLWESEPVRAGEDGTYAIRLDPDRLPGRYFPVGHDFVNFDLNVVDDDAAWAGWSTTAWLLEDARVWRTERSRPGDAALEMSLDLGEGRITLTDSQGRAETHEIAVGGQ